MQIASTSRVDKITRDQGTELVGGLNFTNLSKISQCLRKFKHVTVSDLQRQFDLILCSVCAGKTVDQHNHLHVSIQFFHSTEVMNRLKQQLKIKSCNSHDINSYDFHAVLI